MISTFAEFKESVLFELYILESTIPNFRAQNSTLIDVRQPGTIARTHSCVVSFNDESVNELKSSLTPLIFGAAWKVIDLLVELSLNQSGAHKTKKRWLINDKKLAVDAGIDNSLFPDCHSIGWRAMLAAYSATVEHRHALVHRQANIDSQGDLKAFDKNGTALKTLTQNQQVSFSKAVYILVESILSGKMNHRTNEHLKFYLNNLSIHTDYVIPCIPPNPPVIVHMELLQREGRLILDLKNSLDKALVHSPSETYFNLKIDVPGDSNLQLFAFAEDCPMEPTVINLENLPPWISFKN